MMSSTSIIYHSESILEMQILCIGLVYLTSTHNTTSTYSVILAILFIEHLFSYFVRYFRSWEIKHYGKVDVNGVTRAQKEAVLASMEIFVDCVILGYTLNTFLGLSNEELQYESH